MMQNNRLIDDALDGEVLLELASATTTDAGNAECMALLFRNSYRYCHTRKEWMRWDSIRWVPDQQKTVRRAAIEVARARQEAAFTISDLNQKRQVFNWSLNSENESRQKAALSTAQSLEEFSTTVEDYDRDPDLVGTRTGLLDLRTRTCRPARPDDYITMLLGADYKQAVDAPQWDQFVSVRWLL